MDIEQTMREVHRIAVSKGWWERERVFPEMIALMHSELSEALEAWRIGEDHIATQDDGKPEGVVIELADCVIRIMDACEAMHLPLAHAIQLKMEYNEKRPYRHGGLRA